MNLQSELAAAINTSQDDQIWRGVVTGTLGDLVYVRRAEQSVADTQPYPHLDSYTPTVADEVIVARVGKGYIIIGKVVRAATAPVAPSNYPFINVAQYGALADGNAVTDTAGINLAISVLNNLGRGVLWFPSSGYKINAQLSTITAPCLLMGPWPSIGFDATYAGADVGMFYFSTADARVENMKFDATNAPAGGTNRFFLWFHGLRGRVANCHFSNLAGGGGNFNGAVAVDTVGDYFEGSDVTSDNCPGTLFTQGAYSKFANCHAKDPTDVSFVLNDVHCVGASIVACSTESTGACAGAHIAVEEGPSEWTIDSCVVVGVQDCAGIQLMSNAYTTLVQGGLIKGCLIDGAGLTATLGILLEMSAYYANVTIQGCTIINGPNCGANADNPLVRLNTAGTRFLDNIVIAGPDVQSAVLPLIQIIPGDSSVECLMEGNYIQVDDAVAGIEGKGRYAAADFTGANLRIYRNQFHGSPTTGIGVVNMGTNLNFLFEDNRPLNAIIAIYHNSFGFGNHFYNPSAGGADNNDSGLYPHHVGTVGLQRFWAAKAGLTAGITPIQGTWAIGDTIEFLDPVTLGSKGSVCTAAGTQGTWKGWGAVL